MGLVAYEGEVGRQAIEPIQRANGIVSFAAIEEPR